MSRHHKKTVLLMTPILFVLCIVLCSSVAKAEDIDNNIFAQKIKGIKDTFKDGEYWNYYSASDYSHSGNKSCYCKSYCAGDCSCKCGQFYYNGTWYGGQCHGYALKLGNLIFGGNPAGWGTHSDANKIVAGDIVRAKFSSAGLHTIFVYKVDGSTVYYTDCNFVGPCKIRWGGTYSKSTIGSKNSLTIYHASNNKCTTGIANPEPERATLDVNFFINGNDIVDISGIGSFTIKVGSDTYTEQTDFCRSDIAVGTSYTISNIKASSGYSYTGVSEGSLSGSVGSGRTNIRLNFYNIYTVQYNANGGSGAPSSQTKTHGKTLTLSRTKPKRDHYVFLGWATSKNATSAAYQPGGNYTSNAGTTLYAVWKPEEYAVTYDGNGDNVGNVPASQSKVYGTDLTLSALIMEKVSFVA